MQYSYHIITIYKKVSEVIPNVITPPNSIEYSDKKTVPVTMAQHIKVALVTFNSVSLDLVFKASFGSLCLSTVVKGPY